MTRRMLLAAALALAAGCASAPRVTMFDVLEPETLPAAKAMAKAATTTCGQPIGHYADTTYTCAADPLPRVHGAVRLRWQGVHYLLVNRANEIQLVKVEDPRRPDWRGSTSFRVGNQGDSDSDLMAFAVCDDCRWGVAWYKLATVVFDLGTASSPNLSASTPKRIVYGATAGLGGATWSHGGVQWLATSSLGGDCQASTLYRVAGLTELSSAGCVVAGARPVSVVRGLYDRGSVYLTDSSTRLYHFLAGGSGLDYRGEIGRASYGGYSWTGLDAAPGVLVAASNSGTTVWDTEDPKLPIVAAVVAGNASVATVQPPLLVLGMVITDQHRERIYDVSDPAHPVERAGNLWPDTHPCTGYQSSTLAGEVLYSWRWSIAESFDLKNCVAAAPAARIFADDWESGSTLAWSSVQP